MIPSHKRLSGKDVSYMLRRGKKYYGKIFICVVVDQFRNRSRHQASFQIPVKVDKRATMRNLLKRTAQAEFWKQVEEQSGSDHTFLAKCDSGFMISSKRLPHKKRFFFVNKKNIAPIVALLETSGKTTIVKKRREYCRDDFSTFIESVGKNQSKRK